MQSMKNNKHLAAFTLAEMLMVTLILSVVALATFATLNNGLKIWQRINRQLPAEDLNFFFDKFSVDLRNSFKFSNINFLGSAEKLEFATLVNSPRLDNYTVGKLIYVFEPKSKTLNRYLMDYSAMYTGQLPEAAASLKNVNALKFQYYVFDLEQKEYLWQDEYRQAGLPLAVRVELELDNAKEIKESIKTVSIPSSN